MSVGEVEGLLAGWLSGIRICTGSLCICKGVEAAWETRQWARVYDFWASEHASTDCNMLIPSDTWHTTLLDFT